MKQIRIFVFIILSFVGFIIYDGYITQKKEDNQTICDCRNKSVVSEEIIFFTKLKYNSNSYLKVKINNENYLINKKADNEGNIFFKIKYSFSNKNNDTIFISSDNKQNKIYNFLIDTLIINSKKGIECGLKGAKVNGVFQKGLIFNLK